MLGHRNRALLLSRLRAPLKTGWWGCPSRRTMRAKLEKFDFHDLANTGGWPIGHANDPVAEKERFIDIVGDHHGRKPLSTPKTDQNFLKLIAREGIEHSKWLVEQQHFRSKGKGTRDAHPLAHALGKL